MHTLCPQCLSGSGGWATGRQGSSRQVPAGVPKEASGKGPAGVEGVCL